MKNNYVILFAITLFCCTIYPMEKDIELNSLQQKQIPQIQVSLIVDQKSVIEAIDNAINEEYRSTNSFINLLISPSLSEKDMLSLLELVDTYCTSAKTLFTSIVDILYKKNNFFSKTIDHFTELGCKNIHNVTADTLDIINDCNATQPVKQLNKLSLPIKQYIISRAWNSIKTNYTVEFKHSQPVYIYSLCPTSNKLIIHSTDKNLHLWNFDTGKKIDVFPENTYLSAISFNNDGSQFATAAYYGNEDKSLVKIWHTASKKIMCTFSQDNFIYHLNFLENTSNNILGIFINKNNKNSLNLYTIDKNIKDKNIKPVFFGTIPSAERIPTFNQYGSDKNYEISFCDDERSIVYLTKKTCPGLYLCKQAIKNGIHTDASFIYKSKAYAQLTEFEKKIIKEKSSEEDTSSSTLPQKKTATL